MKATVLLFTAAFSGLALAAGKSGPDHSKHNCCYQNEGTSWVWTVIPDLTKYACGDYGGASYANGVCTENPSIQRIGGKDFVASCKKYMGKVKIQEADHIGAGYRGTCN